MGQNILTLTKHNPHNTTVLDTHPAANDTLPSDIDSNETTLAQDDRFDVQSSNATSDPTTEEHLYNDVVLEAGLEHGTSSRIDITTMTTTDYNLPRTQP